MKKLLIVTLLVLLSLSANLLAVDITEEIVGQSSDDCRVNSNSATFSLLSQLYVNDFTGVNYDWECGMRFTTIPVPNGATITAATITVRADNTIPTYNPSYWVLQDNDDTSTFSNYADYSGRSRYGNIAWSPASWSAGNDYTSPSLVTFVQRIVDKAGWSSGNSMVFFLTPTGGWNSLNDRFTIASYDSNPSNAPRLNISYTVAGGQVIMVTSD